MKNQIIIKTTMLIFSLVYIGSSQSQNTNPDVKNISLTGEWQGLFNFSTPNQETKCQDSTYYSLTQKGRQLFGVGYYKGLKDSPSDCYPEGELLITEGKVQGQQVDFMAESGGYVYELSGTISVDGKALDLHAVEYDEQGEKIGSGDLSMQRNVNTNIIAVETGALSGIWKGIWDLKFTLEETKDEPDAGCIDEKTMTLVQQDNEFTGVGFLNAREPRHEFCDPQDNFQVKRGILRDNEISMQLVFAGDYIGYAEGMINSEQTEMTLYMEEFDPAGNIVAKGPFSLQKINP